MLNPEPTLSIVSDIPPKRVVPRLSDLPSFSCLSRTEARQAMEMLTKRDDEVNREEQKLLGKLTALKAHRNELRYRIFKTNAIISPWCRIPADVLIMIFKLVLREDPDMIAGITFTCRQWRQLTLEIPSLWTGLRVTQESGKFLNKIKLFSTNSYQRPLRILYRQDASASGETGWPCWKALLDLSKRWQSFSVEFLNAIHAAPMLLSLVAMPNLQELSIEVRKHVEYTNDAGGLGFNELEEASIPKLASLTIKAFLPPLMINTDWLSQLTKLHIVDRFKMNSASTKDAMNPLNILFVLEQCRYLLEEFIFESPNSGDYWGVFTELPPIREYRISCMSLKRLELTCAAPVIDVILQSTTMDVLEELRVGTASTFTTPQKDVELQVQRASAAVAHLLRYTMRLKSVFIEGLAANAFPTTHTRPTGYLRAFLSKVEYLHVNNVEPLPVVLSLLEKVHRVRSFQPYWYAPRLKHLELSYFAHDVEHLHGSFCDIVRERWYNSRPPHVRVTQLETLILSGDNLLENPAKAQMRRFKPRRRNLRLPGVSRDLI